MSPIALMLRCPSAPTMTWSWIWSFRCFAASIRSRVSRMSCWLGEGSPLGWLWTMMIAVACRSSARRILADMHRRFVDRSFPHRLVGDQHVLGIEEQHAHPLDRLVRHVDAKIIEQGL